MAQLWKGDQTVQDFAINVNILAFVFRSVQNVEHTWTLHDLLLTMMLIY